MKDKMIVHHLCTDGRQECNYCGLSVAHAGIRLGPGVAFGTRPKPQWEGTIFYAWNSDLFESELCTDRKVQ